MGRLTAKQRAALSDSQFAGPGKSFPVPDKSHAKNALARAAGKPVEPRVRAAVAKKFPSLDKPKPGRSTVTSRATNSRKAAGGK